MQEPKTMEPTVDAKKTPEGAKQPPEKEKELSPAEATAALKTEIGNLRVGSTVTIEQIENLTRLVDALGGAPTPHASTARKV